jgi:uncharacterized GH25 family protein
MTPTLRLLALASSLTSVTASAHTFWVELVSGRDGSAAAQLLVGHHLGDAEKVEVGTRSRYARFDAVGERAVLPLSEPNLRLRGHPNAVLPAVAAGAEASGVRMLVVDSTRRESTLPAAKFAAYLEEEHLHDVLARRRELGEEARSGREEYYRCAKAIGGGSAPSTRVTQPVGQELELIPDSDPAFVPAGQRTTFRVLLDGKPLVGRTVTASHLAAGRLQRETAVTDKEGRVSFPAPGAVPWLLALVHMDRSTDPRFDWRSVWSTLWIDRRGAAAKR